MQSYQFTFTTKYNLSNDTYGIQMLFTCHHAMQ